MANLKYWLWLTTLSGLRPEHVFRVLGHFGTPERAYFADPAEYTIIEDLPQQIATHLRQKSLDQAEQILANCDRLGVRILTLQDAEYPERLRNLYDPPTVLYIKGKTFRFDEEVAIGVVGTRKPTLYGEKMAGLLGFELTRCGALVVSGIAQGLDTAAIRGALKAGGAAISVLGNGVDVHYPRENRWLYEDVATAGALISEYPPGTQPSRQAFPQRNRILSGLSLGVVAVECSRERSGTMITARLALDQDRDLFAVSGNADAPMSEGPNWLIQQGAGLVTCGWDIAREYADRFPAKIRQPTLMNNGIQRARLAPTGPPREEKAVDKAPDREYSDLNPKQAGLTEDQTNLLRMMAQRSLTQDELVEETQIPAKRVLAALTVLQISGYVEEKAGKRFLSQVKLSGE